MKVKCKVCKTEDCGRIWKLIKNDWLIIIINRYIYSICKDCKPLFWDERDKFEIFNTFVEDDIKGILKKQNIINSLEGKKCETITSNK